MNDTVELEILATKLTSISEEMCLTLQRTSRSLYVRETADFACAIANIDGRFIAYPQAIGVSGFVGLNLLDTIAEVTSHEALYPGDIIIANDPYRTGGLSTHLPDIQMIAPYFHGDELIGYGWSFVHCSDIGGRVPSSVSPFNDTIFAEGLRIPPVKLVSRGEIVVDVQKLILGNTRTPEANQGDFQAMIAALTVGARRLDDIVSEHGVDGFERSQSYILTQTAAKARTALKQLHDGTYRFVDYLDSDASSGIPVRIAVAVSASDGELAIDFSGTDPQVAAAFNIVSFGRPHAWITTRVLALLSTLDPLLPLNAGLMDVISLSAERGSLVHAVAPAAVGVRHATASRVNDVLSGAMIQAAPAVLPAANSGLVVPVVFAEDDGDQQIIQVLEPMVGGTGARFGADGVDGRDSGISNLANNPVETVEAEVSVRVHHYGLRTDSGGAGKWRGGAGLELEFEVLRAGSLLARGLERMTFRPWGFSGGQPGARTELVINPGRDDETRPKLVDVIPLLPGDRVVLRTSGAGGYGDPFQRDVFMVTSDIQQGLISVRSARDDYGVAVHADDTVDQEATALLRDGRSSTGWGFGIERERWDTVFDADEYDRFSSALTRVGPPQRHQQKVTLLGRVLELLPAGFPDVATNESELTAARRAFEIVVAELDG